MAREAATAWETGGGGPSFERLVAATYLLSMLENIQPFPSCRESIAQVFFQARSDGWLYDDIVLRMEGEKTWYAAISIKSGDLFKTEVWQETLSDGWEMLEAGVPFVRDRDRLVIETAPLVSQAGRSLQSLCRLASAIDPILLNQRISAEPSTISKKDREFYKDKCARPAGIADKGHGLIEAHFLRHLIVRTRDFRSAESQDLAHVLLRCRDVLVEVDPKAGSALWESLHTLAGELGTREGSITRDELLANLRQRHRLKGAPDVRADFSRMLQWSGERQRVVAKTIGGTLTMPRQGVTERLVTAISSHALCVIVGPSGAGKTVAALTACAAFGSDSILYVRAEDIRSHAWDQLIGGFHHPLEQILRLSPASKGVLILDGGEALDSPGLIDDAKRLARNFMEGNSDRAWRFIVTVQDQALDQIYNIFQDFLQEIRVEPIGPLGDEDLTIVVRDVPHMGRLISAGRLAPIFRYPKILDIVARHIEVAADLHPDQGITELDVFECYWRRVINVLSPVEKQALQSLAIQQGDSGIQQSPLADLSPSVAAACPEIERVGICRTDTWGTVSFTHDILAEWMRLGALLAQGERAEAMIKDRLLAWRWRPAIRLWMQRHLGGGDGFERWSAWWHRDDLWRDLALDGLIQSRDARPALRALWPSLIANEGKPLQRLLRRFGQTASIPDPRFVEVISRMGASAIEFSSILRAPLFDRWPALVEVMCEHLPEALRLAADDLACLATLWLKNAPPGDPLAPFVVRIALESARHAWSCHVSHSYRGRDRRPPCYEALFAALNVSLAPSVDVLLLLVGRRLPRKDESSIEFIKSYTPPGVIVNVHTGLLSQRRPMPMPAPWQDGPLYCIDDELRTLLYDSASAGLIPLMCLAPGQAGEVLLAAAIQEPRAVDPEDDHGHVHNIDHAGLVYFYGGDSYHPSNSVWWKFLCLAPSVALDTIIRLVDFSTEKALEAFARDEYLRPSSGCLTLVIANQRVDFSGGSRLLDWHLGHWAHPFVIQALMSLERYCYEQIKMNGDLGAVFSALLVAGRSSAFLGVLWEIARFQPALLRGPLRPLISCAGLHEWEVPALTGGVHRVGAIPMRAGEKEHARAVEWVNMPHRIVQLSDEAVRLFILDFENAEFYASARRVWADERVSLKAGDRRAGQLEYLIACFTEENYSQIEGGKYRFALPEKLASRRSIEAESARGKLFALNVVMNGAKAVKGELVNVTAAAWVTALRQLLDLEFIDGEGEHETIAEAERLRRAAIVACTAALYVGHLEWLDKQPTEERLCRIWARLAIRIGIPDQSDFIEFDKSFMSIEPLAAPLAVIWASRKPTRAIGLLLMAKLCHTKRRASTEAVFEAAWKYRDRVAADLPRFFKCLTAVAVVISAHRKINHLKRWGKKDPKEISRVERLCKSSNTAAMKSWGDWCQGEGRVESKVTYAVSAIANGTYQELPPKQDLRVPKGGKDIVAKRQSFHRLSLGIDLEWLVSATISHIRPSQVQDAAERGRWCGVLGQALKGVLAELQTYDGSRRVIDDGSDDDQGIQYDYQREVIRVCAEESLRIDDVRVAMGWWREVLASRAQRIGLLKIWFQAIFHVELLRTGMEEPAQRWFTMLDELNRLDGFQLRRLKWKAHEAWQLALGFSDFSIHIMWDAAALTILFRHQALLQDFFKVSLSSAHEARWAFRIGLAAPVLLRALVCDCALAVQASWNEWWWKEGTADDLARILVERLEVDMQPPAQYREQRMKYLPLVRALSEQVHPQAEQLLERVHAT